MSQQPTGEAARLATLDDIETVAQLRSNHLRSIEGDRGASLLVNYELPAPDGLDLGSAVRQDDQLLIVGTYDGVVFGYGLASIAKLENGELLGRLREFIVDAEIRKSGIGEAIMNLALEELRSRGCIGVDSSALPGDRNTKNFFESFGLKARLLTVHRSF